MRQEFISAIQTHQPAFGMDLADDKIARLADYYEIIQKHNEFLHLVAPMSAEEFAIRHILESLMLIKHFPSGTLFADVGAGGGLPSIPCLLVRGNVKAVLIESRVKKAKFLAEAVESLGIANRVQVVNKQFEEVDGSQFSAVTCRALDKFTAKLPHLVKWFQRRPLFLFGGNNLREELKKLRIVFTEELMPMSAQRFLFISAGSGMGKRAL
ncbi:MAG: 16S rRNA (guanine(527)-N(7))-methyltransferase RsmG [Saprospiraceae bacterium]|nr:16S rRNA (guanine(527)-N(7))-methyltransferase RsmG [Pyrinomonadaceae bacterium]